MCSYFFLTSFVSKKKKKAPSMFVYLNSKIFSFTVKVFICYFSLFKKYLSCIDTMLFLNILNIKWLFTEKLTRIEYG